MKSPKQVLIDTLERKIEEKKNFLSTARLTNDSYKSHVRELTILETELKEIRSPTMN